MNLVKGFVFTAIQALLWITFFMYMNDPIMNVANAGVRPTDSIFSSMSAIFNIVYSMGGFFMGPVFTVFSMIPSNTLDPMSLFPMMSAAALNGAMRSLGDLAGMGEMASSLFPATMYPGAVLWAIPVSSLMYFVVGKLLDPLMDKAKNFAWFLMVENSAQKKKSNAYQKELTQRSQDLDRLQARVHNLAQEANSLKDSVITDELTKVYNKRFFLDRLSQELEGCRQQRSMFCLIMIDIDFFKKLNDNYGHLAGDDVLKQVSAVLKRFTPEQCYPCRFGGEEFGIIMANRQLNEATEVARTIQEQVQKLRFPKIDEKLRVTISQGLCAVDFACPESKGVTSYDDILQLADEQLYKSKENGRNRVSTAVLMSPPPQAQAANE